MNKQLFTQEQIDYVTSQVEQYQNSICPQLTANIVTGKQIGRAHV